ncbi:hypothetical protein [Sphingomonas trueperi]|uniref:hypothetical protein n=1 Tax=Sphingomonas trueperi TaxID=53317 RepID=UPI000F2DD4D4
MELTKSETFATDGSTISATYPGTGPGTVTASSPAVTVAYDATNGNYVVTSGSRSQSFRSSDMDAATSTPQLTVFQRTTGDTTDSLTLTSTGTSGAYRYRYVGAGFWQQTSRNGNALSGSVDAFTYGVRTLPVALPRTGLASYAVDLIGVQASPTELASLAGTGQLDVDFTAGKIGISGTGRSVGLVQGMNFDFDFLGLAKLTSDTGQFDGTMSLSMYGVSGTLTGRFYGPEANEVGASFATKHRRNDGVVRTVGTITGRKDMVSTETLASIGTPRTFDVVTATLGYALDSATGTVVSTRPGIGDRTKVAFDPAAGSYGLYDTSFTAATLVAAESTDRIKTYRVGTGTDTKSLRIYVPSGSRGELVLNYAGFGMYTNQDKPFPSLDGFGHVWFSYGIATAPSAMPRAGTASFTGELYGNAQRLGAVGGYEMRGTASLDVNFARGGGGSVTGTLAPVFTPTGGGASFDYGKLSFSGSFDKGSSAFNGNLLGAPGATRDFEGYGFGQFFGPHGEEAAMQLAGKYKAPSGVGNAVGELSVAGVLVARRP